MKWDERYKVLKILYSLRENMGDSEFGLRIQGLLAHTLIRLGVKILEVKSQGHPDIVGEVENTLIKLEVEVAVGREGKRLIKEEDLEAIKPYTKGETGYLAILDCGLMLRWFLIDYSRLKWRCSEFLLMTTLQALSNARFSLTCTEEFFSMILSNAEQLPNFTFSLLRDRALKGERL